MRLHSDAYLSLQFYPELSHARLIRTAQQFGSVHKVAGSLRACATALKDREVSTMGLLLDWRLAPLTTDPVLLKNVVQRIDVFAAAFARRALLVATPVGLLQSERLARTISHAKPVLFSDEAAAVAYVEGKTPPSE